MAKSRWKCCPSPRLDPQPDGGTVCTSCGAEQLGLGVVASKPSQGNEAAPKTAKKSSDKRELEKLYSHLSKLRLHLATAKYGTGALGSQHLDETVPVLYRPTGETCEARREGNEWLVRVGKKDVPAEPDNVQLEPWLLRCARITAGG